MRWCAICQQPWSFAYCGQHREQRQPQATLSASARVSVCGACDPRTMSTGGSLPLAAVPCPSSGLAAAWPGGQRDPPSAIPHVASARACGTRQADGRLVGRRRLRPGPWLLHSGARRPALVEPCRGCGLADSRAQPATAISWPSRCVPMILAMAPSTPPSVPPSMAARALGRRCMCHCMSGTGDTIRLTEGELKADVATVLSGILTVSIPGVAMWRKALPVLQAPAAFSGCCSLLMPTGAPIPMWPKPSGKRPLPWSRLAMRCRSKTGILPWGKGIDDLLAAGHTPAAQSVALAFGASVRGQARPWTGQLRTVAAEEVPPWR